MVAMAARLNEIANSSSADFGGILQAYNDEMASGPGEPVAQQQQQIQPKKEDEKE